MLEGKTTLPPVFPLHEVNQVGISSGAVGVVAESASARSPWIWTERISVVTAPICLWAIRPSRSMKEEAQEQEEAEHSDNCLMDCLHGWLVVRFTHLVPDVFGVDDAVISIDHKDGTLEQAPLL